MFYVESNTPLGVCNDGVCDSNENCSFCPEDCPCGMSIMSTILRERTSSHNFIVGKTPCPGNPVCSGNGECIMGVCACNGSHTGPLCEGMAEKLEKIEINS